MAANTKRLDLRFGSFACSVQGFDDPVMPVQQVLRAIQHLLEETPDLADAGISFDAEAIENLIEEVARRAELASEDIEITPGLVIVHRGENDATPRFDDGEYHDDEPGAGGEAWSLPFTGGGDEAEEAGGGEPSYVNIFSQQDGGEEFPAAAELAGGAEDEAPDSAGDIFAERLGRAGYDEAEPAQAAPRDIFGETGGGGGGVFADPMAPAGAPEDDDEEEPLNLFAAAPDQETDEPETGGAGAGGNIFADFAPGGGSGATDGPEEDGAEDTGDTGDAGDGRVQSLFGDTGDQPEPDEATDGYTVGGLVQAAGAKNVPEMMVSAAAWMVLLRGQTSFTRREVMDVFDRIPGDHDKSLQARIKGFGKAVRNGQIVMVEDGVFGLSRTELDRFEALL